MLLHCLDGNAPPAKVRRAIDDYLGNFLWSGDMCSSKKAKIAWDEICLPKEERGLGLMKSKSWNKAAMMKHIWKILQRSGTSLQADWINDISPASKQKFLGGQPLLAEFEDVFPLELPSDL